MYHLQKCTMHILRSLCIFSSFPCSTSSYTYTKCYTDLEMVCYLSIELIIYMWPLMHRWKTRFNCKVFKYEFDVVIWDGCEIVSREWALKEKREWDEGSTWLLKTDRLRVCHVSDGARHKVTLILKQGRKHLN